MTDFNREQICQGYEILGITPATGWYAVYRMDEVAKTVYKTPLAVWALAKIKDDGDSRYYTTDVLGIEATVTTLVCDESSNFMFYVHESESEDDVRDRIDHYFKEREKVRKWNEERDAKKLSNPSIK